MLLAGLMGVTHKCDEGILAMLESQWWTAVAIVVAVFLFQLSVGALVSIIRRPAWRAHEKWDYMHTLVTAAPVGEVLMIVLNFALRSRYNIDNVDEQTGRVVLSDDMALMTWGFFHFVRVVPDESGKTLIEVGTTSKFVQSNIITARYHERCFAAIKAAVLAAGHSAR